MKEQVKKSVIKELCSDFVDGIIVGIEEYEEDFPYTIACINFITELKEKNINVNLNAFIDTIRSNLYDELTNYLAR